MAYSSDDLRWGNVPQHFFRHLIIMPSWHKGVLLLAVVLGIIGGTGSYANHKANRQAADATKSANAADSPRHGSWGYGNEHSPRPSETNGQSNDAPGLQGKLANFSSPAWKIGISVVAGFIFGWVFRGFLKTMAFLALVVFGLFAALSYFHVINVDLTEAKAEYATAMQWATGQFWKLKDVVVGHLPSSSGGTVGAFLGFKRR